MSVPYYHPLSDEEYLFSPLKRRALETERHVHQETTKDEHETDEGTVQKETTETTEAEQKDDE